MYPPPHMTCNTVEAYFSHLERHVSSSSYDMQQQQVRGRSASPRLPGPVPPNRAKNSPLRKCVLSVYSQGHRAEPLTGLPGVRQKGGLPGPPLSELGLAQSEIAFRQQIQHKKGP